MKGLSSSSEEEEELTRWLYGQGGVGGWWCWRGRKGGREAGKNEGGGERVPEGVVILLWKMYWSSWKNRSLKKKKGKRRGEEENLGVRGTGALACGWTHRGLCLLGSFQVQVFPSLTLRERRSCPWLKGPALDGLQPLLRAPQGPCNTNPFPAGVLRGVCGERGHALGKRRSFLGGGRVRRATSTNKYFPDSQMKVCF